MVHRALPTYPEPPHTITSPLRPYITLLHIPYHIASPHTHNSIVATSLLPHCNSLTSICMSGGDDTRVSYRRHFRRGELSPVKVFCATAVGSVSSSKSRIQLRSNHELPDHPTRHFPLKPLPFPSTLCCAINAVGLCNTAHLTRPPLHLRSSPQDASEHDKAFSRIATPIAKYFICKQAPGVAYEAMECLGGNGQWG